MREAVLDTVVLCANMSSNCLGRAIVLAEVARHLGTTRIIGIQPRNSIWGPAANSDIAMESFRVRRGADYLRAISWLRRSVGASRIIISKPRLANLGIAAAAGLLSRPCVLDIDDWEVGLMMRELAQGPVPANYRPAISQLLTKKHGINAPWILWLLEAMVPRFSSILVSNTWLQKRFGGELLPHLRDTTALDPAKWNRTETRAKLELRDRIWVCFAGTIRRHKGVEELVEAVRRSPPEVGLLLCGVNRRKAYVDALVHKAEVDLGDRLRVVGQFPVAELPSYLSAADIVCVPSPPSSAATGQLPAKLFDAMSMGLPVVATNTGDTALVLGDAGLIVPSQDPQALAEAFQRLASEPSKRAAMSTNARMRAQERFDIVSGVSTLREALNRATPPLSRRTPPRRNNPDR